MAGQGSGGADEERSIVSFLSQLAMLIDPFKCFFETEVAKENCFQI